MNKQKIYDFLHSQNIPFEITEHKAVYNMAELAEIPLPHPEADAKNLFIRDDKRRSYYLLTVFGEKRVDLKAFRREHGTRPLTFASAEDLEALLGLYPGAVTPLGLLNDAACRVKLFIDRDLADGWSAFIPTTTPPRSGFARRICPHRAGARERSGVGGVLTGRSFLLKTRQ